MIRRALYLALERARLIAEKSLCLPHLEFASCAWESFANKNIEALELDRCEGVRIICDLKGRRGLMEAKGKLELQPLNVRRQKPRLKLLLKILSERGSLPALCASYDEILNQTESTIWSRSQYRKEPRYIATSRSWYYNSLLSCTILNLKKKWLTDAKILEVPFYPLCTQMPFPLDGKLKQSRTVKSETK